MAEKGGPLTVPRDLSTITVGELRDMIEGHHDDERIGFACDYGDHGHTQQVLGFSASDPEQHTVVESGYSNSGYALPDADDEEEGDDAGGDKVETFLIFRAS